ncbi:MAG: hypothetical protein K9G41_04320 [Flavobacteriales bacterium]|nr:hypothetical protein [Flavobacteriales bacterium]
MKAYIKHSGILALCIATLNSCTPEDPLSGTTITLDCDYFNEDRVLVDDPEVSIDYLITCDMSVNADVTVMPGVTIAFATDAGITIEETGSFRAEGTPALPITFEGEDGLKGSWRGIIAYSNDPKNIFDHCIVEHAGGIAHNSNGDRGAFVVWAEGRLSLTNSIVRLSASHGLNATYSDAWLELGGNTFTENDGAPLYLEYHYVNVPSASDSYIGNDNPRILLESSGSTVNVNTTWKKVNVDYQVEGGVEIQVRDAAALTIEPGVNVYFESGSSMYVTDEAALVAVGTVQAPIGLYGFTAANGAWGGLYYAFTSNVQNVLDHVTLQHAGNTEFEGAVYMWADPKLTVLNSEISNSGSCAFFAGGAGAGNANLTVNDVVFVNNAGADYCVD